MQHVIQIKDGIIKHVSVNVNFIFGIPAHVFVKKASILKSIADTSVIECDEITTVMDIVSTNMTNTIV